MPLCGSSARHAANVLQGTGSVDAAPRSFTLGGASAPNGLREEIELGSGRVTAIAIAQAGEWLVKLRMTSDTLGGAALAERMDRLLAAITFRNPLPAPHPLTVPAPCEGEREMRGSRTSGSEADARVTVWGLIAYGEARGLRGPAAEPGSWCRMSRADVPAQYVSLYRQRDGSDWVALVGDAGRAVSASSIDVPGETGAGLFASMPAATHVVAPFDGVPDPERAIAMALPVVLGNATGIAEIGTQPQGGRRARRN